MNWPPLRRADDDPRRRRFRKGIYLLPSLFTTLNMALGYYALYHAIQGSVAEPWHYDNAAKAIGFAIIFDGLDGKIARMTNTESDFGREFDSLADVITFGVAPAILAWMWGFRILATLNGSDLLARVVHLGAIATFAFLIAPRVIVALLLRDPSMSITSLRCLSRSATIASQKGSMGLCSPASILTRFRNPHSQAR